MSILTSDRVDFSVDFRNGESFNPPRRHNNWKYECTKQQSYKICEVKMIELKGKINKLTITLDDFNIPLSTSEETTRQDISKDTDKLTNVIS